MSDQPKGPNPSSKAQAERWYEIWFRHAVFGEGPLEIERYFRSVGKKLQSQTIDDALAWGAANSLRIVADRRALRARTAASIAARSKLVWGEIHRLQSAQRQGGTKETTLTYDAKGKLKSTRITQRDASRDLVGAARALADLDRFSAAVDGLLVPDPGGPEVGAITMELSGFFDAAYVDPADADLAPQVVPEEHEFLHGGPEQPLDGESIAPEAE